MQIKTNAGYIFDQLQTLLEKLSDEQYVLAPEIFSGASIGKHYRHIIEFFQCVSIAGDTDTICYDNRIRDTRIETNRKLAIELLTELSNELAELDDERRLILIGDLGTGNGSSGVNIGTTLFREFHYAVEHAINHMAITKMGVKQTFPEVLIPIDFGVAPSTVRYQQTAAINS